MSSSRLWEPRSRRWRAWQGNAGGSSRVRPRQRRGGARPVRSAPLGGVVSPYDVGDVRPGVSRRAPCAGAGPVNPSRRTSQRPGRRGQKGAVSAAARLDRGGAAADRAERLPACAVGGGPSGFSGGGCVGVHMVAVATPSWGACQALPLPASPRSPMT